MLRLNYIIYNNNNNILLYYKKNLNVNIIYLYNILKFSSFNNNNNKKKQNIKKINNLNLNNNNNKIIKLLYNTNNILLNNKKNKNNNNIINDKNILRIENINKSWIEKILPNKFSPYIKLTRIDRPIGVYLLLWPCIWGIFLAGQHNTIPDLYNLSLFISGAFIMRSAGCTINDMWDKNYDKKVTRTKLRPFASNEIPIWPNGMLFLGSQLSIGLLILLQFQEMFSIYLGMASLPFVLSYPLMKRITNWPQLILGMTFNWGALLGYSVVKGGLDMTSSIELIDIYNFLKPVIPLYLAGISWTIIYDTIYAHQDKLDDIKLGLKSTALYFGNKYTKPILSLFAISTIFNLTLTGYLNDLSSLYYITLYSLGLPHLYWQVKTADLNDSNNLNERFKASNYFGFFISLGILLGHITM